MVGWWGDVLDSASEGDLFSLLEEAGSRGK